MSTNTADEHRAAATASRERAAESFERCDTDGFLSQWASGLDARKHDLAATIAEQGGRHSFPALFDMDGNLVAAKLVATRYGDSWALLETDDPRSRFVGWFRPSTARKAATRNANNAKKGYSVGWVLAPAYADLGGGGTGMAGAMSVSVVARRSDGGFSRGVETVTRIQDEDWQ